MIQLNYKNQLTELTPYGERSFKEDRRLIDIITMTRLPKELVLREC